MDIAEMKYTLLRLIKTLFLCKSVVRENAQGDDQYVCTKIWLLINTHMITSGLVSTLGKFGKIYELS